MADLPKVDDALDRFNSAVNDLEAALVRLRETGQNETTGEGEAHALREDRARLANELDEVRANAERLHESSRAAAEKVASAMSQIKFVLGENQP